jgi:DNA-binding protein H-NS
MMDLSNMSAAELRNLQEQIKQQLKLRESQELAKAREQIQAIAQSVGVPLKDLIGSGAVARSSKGSTVAPRYRNPSDGAQQWSGRGRKPQWVKDWLASGKAIDLLRV